LDGIKGNATAIIVPDEGKFKVVAAKGDDGDIPVTGGQSFIITAKRTSQVRISGLSWSNEFRNKMTSAPSILPQTNTPLLVLNGRLINEGQQVLDNKIEFTIRRLGGIQTDIDYWQSQALFNIEAETKADGTFTATQVNFQEEHVISINDILQIEVMISDSQLKVSPVIYQVTSTDIRDGLISLPDLVAYQVPEYSALGRNYPNPFNPETWIPYQLATDSQVELTIYDSSGLPVRKIQLGYQTAGHYITRQRSAYWDGRNEIGETISSGIYFYVLKMDSAVESRTFSQKMIVIK
jgi:hypothetical protein